jgi:hypothetical protein
MAYYKTPINYPSGLISEDTQKINDNFTQLALAFLNDDPTTGIVKKADNANNADKVDGFHASQTPTANTIPVADANGKIDTNWLKASTTPSANQIPVLDANANLILPNTSLIKTNIYTFRRVDLTNATSDYPLAVGEEAIINFTNATSVPLHIKVTNLSAVYYILFSAFNNLNLPTAYTTLYPNNTSYSSSFSGVALYWNSSGDGGFVYYSTSLDGFRLYNQTPSMSLIINLRQLIVFGYSVFNNGTNNIGIGLLSGFWHSNLISWTSLGTLILPFTLSGQILIRRLV